MKDGKLVSLLYLQNATDNDEELIREILDIFLQDTKQELDKLQQAVTEDRWKDVGKIAHRLKSSMLNLDLEEISQELLSIEDSINKNTGLDEIKQRVMKIFDICQEVFQDVMDILES